MGDSAPRSITLSRILSTYAIVIFAILWVGFVIALLVNPVWLDLLWNWVESLPLVAEIIIWVLFLPIMIGLWGWVSSWLMFVNLIVFAGLVGWTVLAMANFFRYAR